MTGPGRLRATAASMAVALAQVVEDGRPEWVSAKTWALLERALEGLRADARKVLDTESATQAAVVLGLSRAALYRHLEGWLR